ncbi:MAG: hypothetical protein NC483_05490 [Ruminococcus sp.]|nr:hypothetical protein [Ruminococcus sp.]
MKNHIYYIIIIILASVIASGVTYIVMSGKNSNVNNINVNNELNDDGLNNNINNENESQTQSLKIDNTKDYVYDATYDKKVAVNSYTTGFNNTYYAKDIIVPFININSPYVIGANYEIKNVFDSAISAYNQGVNDKLTYIDYCNYKKFIDNNILSLILTYGVGATSIVHPNYYTYNIDIKTGNKLSYRKVFSLLGYQDYEVFQAIEKYLIEEIKLLDEDFDMYYNQSATNYEASVANGTIRFFIDENKKLNIIVTIVAPVDIGFFDKVITIEHLE